jgi:hypothetical protein
MPFWRAEYSSLKPERKVKLLWRPGTINIRSIKKKFRTSVWNLYWAVTCSAWSITRDAGEKSRSIVRCRCKWQQYWTWQQVNNWQKKNIWLRPRRRRYTDYETKIGVPPAKSAWDIPCKVWGELKSILLRALWDWLAITVAVEPVLRKDEPMLDRCIGRY